ncbi:MAG: hypothetical protein LBU18_03645 [Treponema sp.]|jgi:hypothetical protein|nr:hypothetical protein [Treponema sp.]
MDEFQVKRLILASPLVYRRDDSLCFPPDEKFQREFLFRMALDPAQIRRMEPERAAFPGRLFEAGRPAENMTAGDLGRFELPAGAYLFAQVRKHPDAGTLINMIIEVQKEGLWEGLSLDERLYIRRLFEDGQMVTQVFRPFKKAGRP